MEAENLINWGELSRLLSGTRCVITRKRRIKKHEDAINALLLSVQNWIDNNVKQK